MLNFLVKANETTIKASGTHRDMLTEAISLEAQLHRFVYRLGHVEYAVFLAELAKFTTTDDFFDFLEANPDEETRITMPNFTPEDETDDE